MLVRSKIRNVLYTAGSVYDNLVYNTYRVKHLGYSTCNNFNRVFVSDYRC